jgi:hypothetical protein
VRRAKGKSRRDALLSDVLENGSFDEVTPSQAALLAGYAKDKGMFRAQQLFEADIPKKRGRRR